ncbi:MAG: thioredoxin family protein [Thermoanaerobaculia bacterium]|nr:thioredoxin family protein [Thermoanaerobaculia bacterium]
MTRTWIFSALVAALVAAAPAPAQKPAADAFLSDFRVSGEYVVEVAGKAQPKAELYFSERARAFLIRSSELPSPVLVSPSAKEVQSLDLMKIQVGANGVIDVLSDAVLSPEGAFRVDGESILFHAGGREVRLRPRPWLLGAHSGAEIGEHNPEYVRRAGEYESDDALVAKLKAAKGQVRVLTFFGSWCPHCKKHVPMLMKVGQELAGANWQFDYYGLPSPFTNEPEAVKYGIKGVPTAIVLVGGKEIGRLPNSGWTKPEAGLDSVLNGTAGSGSR